eukprot:c48827_g1_i1 orf=1-183(-)
MVAYYNRTQNSMAFFLLAFLMPALLLHQATGVDDSGDLWYKSSPRPYKYSSPPPPPYKYSS